jgi:NAD-dependent dihydropyrimidine dehydrogenase PreA subunit
MAGLFIDVKVTPEVAKDPEIARELEEVCPVGIFDASDGALKIVDENLDECVLCDLCIAAAPQDAVSVIKLYDH